MTASHLVACPGCSRHVRAGETACPFCARELPAELRESAPRMGPAVRLSRAALYAFGIGTATVAAAAAAACSSSSSMPVAEPAYGGSPLYGGMAAIPDAGDDSKAVTAHYGGMAMLPEAGEEEADAAADAKQDVNVAVPYGVPVQPDSGK